jgi:NAD(P)H-dependent flavin oxidoreductase YrpB (nitropropane dioxygenase family)
MPTGAEAVVTDGNRFFTCSESRATKLFKNRCKVPKSKARTIRILSLTEDGDLQISKIARIEPIT